MDVYSSGKLDTGACTAHGAQVRAARSFFRRASYPGNPLIQCGGGGSCFDEKVWHLSRSHSTGANVPLCFDSERDLYKVCSARCRVLRGDGSSSGTNLHLILREVPHTELSQHRKPQPRSTQTGVIHHTVRKGEKRQKIVGGSEQLEAYR